MGIEFEIWDGYGLMHISEGRESAGAHDLGRDKTLEAIDKIGVEQGGIEVRTGFGEEGEDVLGAQAIEHGGKGKAVLMSGDGFNADALGAKFAGAGPVG